MSQVNMFFIFHIIIFLFVEDVAETSSHAPNENEANIGGASNAVNNNGSAHSG